VYDEVLNGEGYSFYQVLSPQVEKLLELIGKMRSAEKQRIKHSKK
jgi:hypothetical protein